MTLLDDFLSDAIAPEDFDHRAHVLAGFALLQHHDLPDATRIYAERLQSLTRRAGVPEKYSATITTHAMALIASRIAGQEDAESFLERNPDLLTSATFRMPAT